MRRAPIVFGATAAGMALVLSFHTSGSKLTTHLSVGSPTTTGGGSTGSDPTTPTSPTTVASSPGSSATSATTTPAASTAARSATGQDVQYRYGDIQLQVTEKGSQITNITVVNEGATDPRSQSINEQAVPMLQQQAYQAQSANINGVSGATFTSAAYAQALQSAIDQLKA